MKKLLSILFFILLLFEVDAQNINKAEYFFNTDPGVGNGYDIPVANTDSLLHNFTFPVTGLNEGFHWLYIRTRSTNGKWAIWYRHRFYIYDTQHTDLTVESSDLVSGEYFYDEDPGVGNGIPIAFNVSDTVTESFSADLTGLDEGFHWLYVRTKDLDGKWAIWKRHRFYVYDTEHTPIEPNNSTLVYAEYFVDTDPGVGNGTNIPIASGDTVVGSFNLDVTPYSEGSHWLYVRTKDNLGQWGIWTRKEFNVCGEVLDIPTISQNTTFCEGSTISLTGNEVTGADSYLWKGPDNFTQNGIELVRENATTATAGEYTLYAIRDGGTGCDTSWVDVQISILPTFESETSQTICFGESYSFNGTDYSTNGTFTEVFQAENGCDSTVILQLTVLPELSSNNPQTICMGSSYSIGNNTYTESGTYTDIFQAVNGCDSTVTTELTVLPALTSDNPQTICFGESYSIGNSTYSSGGTYTDVLTTADGCDSTVTTILTVLPEITSNNPQTVCFGGSYSINGNTYSSSGTYTDVLTASSGCDSTVTTVLTVLPELSVNNPIQICEGGSYSIGGNTYTEEGTYMDVLESVSGCDSTVTTIITLSEVIEITNSVDLCNGGSITVGDNTYSSSGTYTDNFITTAGCDSIVTTIVTVLPQLSSTNPQTVCFGDSYSIGGNTYSSSGTYTDVLMSATGCDSTVTTVLTVLPQLSSTNPQQICNGGSYSIGGNTYTQAGTYVDVLSSVNGCDSTVTTVLSVTDFVETTNPVTICQGQSVTVGNNTYSNAGTYTDIFQSAAGCDSIVTTIVTVDNPELSTMISIEEITLTAIESNATYQWVDCNNNNIYIGGATEQSFTPSQSGSYAVIITSIDCPGVSVTSECYTVTVSGLTEFDWSTLKIYPNPTDDEVFIESGIMIESVKLRDINGKLISTQKVNNLSTSLNLGKFSKGIYLIEVWDGEGKMNISKVVRE